MVGRKIAIVGASGGLGKHTVQALLAEGGHTVTAITRAESSAAFPEGVKVAKGPYDDEAFLVNALTGQDVLVLQVGIMVLDSQIPVIKAAAKAGVPYVIPCEFAQDNKHEKLNQEINLMTRKNKYRQLIDELGVSKWIGVINGPWFDWSFRMKYWGTPVNYWGIDLKNKKASIFDDGSVKMNVSTLQKTGAGTAALLSLPEADLAKYAGDFIYISSFHVSQKDILDSVIKASGVPESQWSISSSSAADAVAACKDAVAKGNGMKNIDLLFAVLAREGYGGDYQSKVTPLNVPQEDFNAVVKQLVDEELAKA